MVRGQNAEQTPISNAIGPRIMNRDGQYLSMVGIQKNRKGQDVRRFVASLSVLCLIGLSLSIQGCGDLNPFRSHTAMIGPRKAVDPLAAAEAYLRQYQPGALPRVFQTTRIFDRKGKLIAETFGEGRRVWVGLDRISEYLIDATVATEDASFYTNSGIDPARIAGAALKNLQEGEVVSGASTITMQLARNLFLGPEQRYDQSVDRKVLEAGLAQELTDLYSKDELLEMYLNLLNYGQMAYGPAAAAKVYFAKSPANLTLAEATLLAGIPQQPANLNPYDNLEAAKRRQRVVLDLMVRHGYLAKAEADSVFAEPITLAGDHGIAPNLAPHFVQYVIEQLDAELSAGYAERAGFKVYTTLDLDMQKLAQDVVTRKVAELQPQYDLSNAALVAVKPGSAELLAMVGSADFNNDAISGQVNIAVSPRQPGSAIKPVLYATAVNESRISPASVIWDVPVTYTAGLAAALTASSYVVGGAVYAPQNYDNRFHGPVTARTALANSYNVPTVELLDAVGVDRMLTMARAMGLHSLNRSSDWYGLSLTLGGGEVTLLDLTDAYHTLADGGQYLPPEIIRELRDSQDRPIEQIIPIANGSLQTGSAKSVAPPQPVRVLTPGTAFLITDILSDNAARLPAFGESSPLVLSRPAAVKTGTTTDFRDNWTVGYTRYLLAGVWAGNSDGHPMQHASGVTGAAPIWHDFMEAVLSRPDLLETLEASTSPEAWAFMPPSDVEQLSDCPPDLYCRIGGEYYTKEWLQTARAAGPLAGSVTQAPAAPVYVQQDDQSYLAGFCTMDSAAEHTLLDLPGTIGLSLPISDTGGEYFGQGDVSDWRPTLLQQYAIAWSLHHGAQADLGPCTSLKDIVPAALALDGQGDTSAMRILVDLAGAADPQAGTLRAGGVDPAALARAVDIGGVAAGGRYILAQSIVNDASCPGQYVMGKIVDPGGAPVAGVRVVMRDSWGNQAQATSKNGSNDYGMFDFPIYGSGPQDLFLTLVDDAGNALSATLTVPHKRDAASDTPCHHVVLQGG